MSSSPMLCVSMTLKRPLSECASLLKTTIDDLYTVYKSGNEDGSVIGIPFPQYVFTKTMDIIRGFVYRYPWLCFRILTLDPHISEDWEDNQGEKLHMCVIHPEAFQVYVEKLHISSQILDARLLYDILVHAAVTKTFTLNPDYLAVYDPVVLTQLNASSTAGAFFQKFAKKSVNPTKPGINWNVYSSYIMSRGTAETCIRQQYVKENGHLTSLFKNTHGNTSNNNVASATQRLAITTDQPYSHSHQHNTNNTPTTKPITTSNSSTSSSSTSSSTSNPSAPMSTSERIALAKAAKLAAQKKAEEDAAVKETIPEDKTPEEQIPSTPSDSSDVSRASNASTTSANETKVDSTTATNSASPTISPVITSTIPSSIPATPVLTTEKPSDEPDFLVIEESTPIEEILESFEIPILMPFPLDTEYPRMCVSEDISNKPELQMWAFSAVDHASFPPSIIKMVLQPTRLEIAGLLTNKVIHFHNIVSITQRTPTGISGLVSQSERLYITYANEPEPKKKHNLPDALAQNVQEILSRQPYCKHVTVEYDIVNSDSAPCTASLLALYLSLHVAMNRIANFTKADIHQQTRCIAIGDAMKLLLPGSSFAVPVHFAAPIASPDTAKYIKTKQLPELHKQYKSMLYALLTLNYTIRALSHVAPQQSKAVLLSANVETAIRPPLTKLFPLNGLPTISTLEAFLCQYQGSNTPVVPLRTQITWPVKNISTSQVKHNGNYIWTWVPDSSITAAYSKPFLGENKEKDISVANVPGDVSLIKNIIRPVITLLDIIDMSIHWKRPVFTVGLWAFLLHMAWNDRLCYLPVLILLLLTGFMLCMRDNPFFLELYIGPWTEPNFPAVLNPDTLGPHQMRRFIYYRARGKDYFGRPLNHIHKDKHPADVLGLNSSNSSLTTEAGPRPIVEEPDEADDIRRQHEEILSMDINAKSAITKVLSFFTTFEDIKETASNVKDTVHTVSKVIGQVKETTGRVNGLLRWHNPAASTKLTLVFFTVAVLLTFVRFKYLFAGLVSFIFIDHFLPEGSAIKRLVFSVPFAEEAAYQFISEIDEQNVYKMEHFPKKRD